MQLKYAILAENADRLSDGRLCMFGGDFDTLQVSEIPGEAAFRIAAKVSLENNEPLTGHTIGIDISNPQGERKLALPKIAIEIEDAPERAPGLLMGAGIIVTLAVKLIYTGMYTIHLVLDDVDVSSLPLHVIVASASPEKAQ